MKVFIFATLLLLASCGSDTNTNVDTDTDPAQATEEDRDTVFDPLTSQLDKARAVEDTTQQHKDDVDAALRKAEGDDGD